MAPSIPIATISAPTYVTAAQVGYAASVPTQANSLYAWSITGGTLNTGATTPEVTFTPSGSGSVHLSCIVTHIAIATTASVKGDFSSTIVPPPVTPVIAIPTYVTSTQPGYVASVPTQANSNYAWSITGGTLTAGGATPSATFTPSSTGSVQLSCVVTNAAGTVSAPGTSTSSIVPPPITPVVSAPIYVTANQAGYAASVTTQSNSTYAWSITGGTLTAGAATPTATFTPSGSGSVQLSCTLTNLAGTPSAPGSSTSTIVLPPTTPVVTAPAYVTAAQAGYVASVSPQANSTYAWSITGGTFTAGGSTPSATFTPSSSGSVQLSCVVSNLADTPSAPGSSTSTIVLPPTTPVVTAPAYVTAAQAGYVASVSPQANSTYAWSITGGTFTAGGSTPSATFTPLSSGSVQLSCVVSNLADTPSAPGSFTSTIVPPPITPVITAPAFAIVGREGYTASTPVAPGNTITWYIDGGLFSAGSAGNAITFNPGTGPSLTLSCVAFNQAGTSSASVGAVVPIAPPPIVPTQQSATLSTLTPAPLALGLPDLRSTARMSVSVTNLSDTSLLNPQVHPENAPLPYTFNDITQTLPLGASDRVLCEASWRYIRDRFFAFCSAASQDSTEADNGFTLFSGLNGFGFGCCEQVARYLAMLWADLGYPSRIAYMSFHTVAEVYYEGAWHMFDPDHRTFYLKRDGQTVASVADILADPELIVLSADTNWFDPVGSNPITMGRLYTENAASLHYGTPGTASALPFPLLPRETFTLFHENQIQKCLFYYYGNPNFITNVTSGLFRWDLPADQQTLSLFAHQVQNVQVAQSSRNYPIFQQASSAIGSLSFRRSSPYPLLATQVWVRREGIQGILSARFSIDGVAWSDPVLFTPNRQRAGFTHSADLGPYLKSHRDYFIRLDLEGGFHIQTLAMESHVQVSRFSFPLFTQGETTRLHYKDDGPQSQVRSVLATLEAAPLDTQIQDLDLARNTKPGATVPSYTEAPELLISPGLSASPSDTGFDFVFTLDHPRLVRKLRALLKNAPPLPVSLSWRVQTRMSPDLPWVDHVAGIQDVLDQLEVDTYITARQIRLLGTALAPIQFRHLAAFGHPPTQAVEAPAVSPASCVTNLRESAAPSAQALIDGNLGTPAVTGYSHLDYTLTFAEPIQASKILLTLGDMAPYFTSITILGLSEAEPTWIRLGTWTGPGSAPSITFPLDARVRLLRIKAEGNRPISLYEVQTFGVPAP